MIIIIHACRHSISLSPAVWPDLGLPVVCNGCTGMLLLLLLNARWRGVKYGRALVAVLRVQKSRPSTGSLG